MTTPYESTERVTQHLVRTEALLPECNPFEPKDTARLSMQVRELTSACKDSGSLRQQALGEIAQLVVDQVSRHGVIGPRDALELVRLLVAEVRADERTSTAPSIALKATPAPAPVLPGQETPAATEAERGLQLVGTRRLGEILVSLSMLTPAQVERALITQKGSGRRFGEALVELGFLRKEALDSVLKMQRQRGSRGPKDPWTK